MMCCFLFLVGDFKRRRLNAPWYAALFIAVVFIALIVFNLGALMTILYADDFFIFARRFYYVFGVLLVVCGALHWRDWWRLKQDAQASLFFPMVVATDEDVSKERVSITVIAPLIAAAVFLCALSTIWPADLYITIQSGFLYMPGRFVESYLIVLVYNFVIALAFVGIFIFISSGFFSNWVQKNLSMFKIILSALTLSLGTGLIYVFR